MTSPEPFNKDIKRVQLLLVALVTVLCALCGHTAAAESKPNIVLFLVDDMGWMDCGVYGSQLTGNSGEGLRNAPTPRKSSRIRGMLDGALD